MSIQLKAQQWARWLFILLFMLSLAFQLQAESPSALATDSTPPAISTPQQVYPPFTNPAGFNIPDAFTGTASSTINVTGVVGNITNITITVFGANHTYTDDINLLVVGPGGQAVILWSDAGGTDEFQNANVTFADGGTVPGNTTLGGNITGNVTYAPSNYAGTCGGGDNTEPDNFAAPGPGTAYTPIATLAAAYVGLSGAAVNGTWSLFAVDDCGADTGGLSGGWAINITDDFTAVALAANAACNLDNLVVNITAGDGPFNITGTGPGLPMNGVAAGSYPLTGPGAWTGVTVTEVGGDLETTNLGNFNCATNLLAATAACLANNLNVNITAGDGPFNITGTGPGLPLNGIAAGTYPLTGPGPWTGVTVTETTGNTETTNLGNFNCATNTLVASAVCTGADLVVTISGGDTPFNIVGTGPGLPMNGVAAGSYTLTGPATWTAVDVAEAGGNLEVATLGTFTCAVAPPPPPPPIIPGIPVPNLGLILIDLGQAQFALQSPNGQPLALTNGTPVLLPHDFDHSGYDTYTVTGIYWIDGEYWLSIFLGNTSWGWVPLDDVTVITPLELPEPVEASGDTK